jgi:hypothetical protein
MTEYIKSEELKTCSECKAYHDRQYDTYCFFCRQAYMRQRAYGITRDEMIVLLEQQHNACAICHKEFTDEPHVDHDHKTGKVRGLLCSPCNLGIGKLEDDIPSLLNAALYLFKEIA